MMRRLAAIVARRSVWLWACEIAGVGVIAIAGWLVAAPLGIFIVGAYLVVVAESTPGGD